MFITKASVRLDLMSGLPSFMAILVPPVTSGAIWMMSKAKEKRAESSLWLLKTQKTLRRFKVLKNGLIHRDRLSKNLVRLSLSSPENITRRSINKVLNALSTCEVITILSQETWMITRPYMTIISSTSGWKLCKPPLAADPFLKLTSATLPLNKSLLKHLNFMILLGTKVRPNKLWSTKG